MVLSRRRVSVLLLVALVVVVVVMALVGIMGVLRAVSASPETAANAKARSTTLTVLAKTRKVRIVDLEPPDASHGDMCVVNAPLYNESATKKVGRLDAFCAVTDPADEPNEKAHMAECTKTFTLPGGERRSKRWPST